MPGCASGCSATTIRSRPGIARALRESRPDVVVVSGWSTFAVAGRDRLVPRAAGSVRAARREPRPRAAPRLAPRGEGPSSRRSSRGAASVLVVGTAARESVVARGRCTERVRVFANTIDVDALDASVRERRVEAPTPRRRRRRALGRPRRAREGLRRSSCVASAMRASVVAGRSERSLRGARRPTGRAPRRGRARADATSTPTSSRCSLARRRGAWSSTRPRRPGLPLVLSDRVGAAYDLLRDGENGFLVPAGDVAAAAAALGRLAADAESAPRAWASARASSSRVGLRAVGRELRRRRARGDRAVDLLLHVGRRGPTTCAVPPPTPPRASRARSSASERTRRTASTTACAVVRERRAPRRPRRSPRCRSGRRRSRACRRRPPRPRPCRSSRRPRRGRTRPPAGRARAAAPRSSGSVWTRLGRRSASTTPWRSSGPATTRCASGISRHAVEQVLDALARRRSGRRRGSSGAPAGMPSCARRSPFGRRCRPAPGSRCRARAPSPAATPHATTSSRSRSDATTTAAAPRATPR